MTGALRGTPNAASAGDKPGETQSQVNGMRTKNDQLFDVLGELVLAPNATEAVIRADIAPVMVRVALEKVKLAEGPLFRPGVRVCITAARHRALGVNASINARAGECWRNQWSMGEVQVNRGNLRREVRRLRGLHHTGHPRGWETASA